MFTGIIEEIGKISNVTNTHKGGELIISAHKIMNGMKTGDSVAVNGTCLTVIHHDEKEFIVELSPETLERTIFRKIKVGEIVNLERPMQINDRIGGHLVSGHVDGVGRVVDYKQEGNSLIIEFSVPIEFSKYLIPKGSVAVDGISLTVVNIRGNQFTVAVIPHTFQGTALRERKIGDLVNLEFDLIAKYIERFSLFHPRSQDINLDFLQSHGYM